MAGAQRASKPRVSEDLTATHRVAWTADDTWLKCVAEVRPLL
jgi:hypothetical protein